MSRLILNGISLFPRLLEAPNFQALKADDLMPLEEENGGGRDIGSR